MRQPLSSLTRWIVAGLEEANGRVVVTRNYRRRNDVAIIFTPEIHSLHPLFFWADIARLLS